MYLLSFRLPLYKCPNGWHSRSVFSKRSKSIHNAIMTFQKLTILLVIAFSVFCSGTQQVVSSTQASQLQSNVRKYNKHTATEKPCTTGSTTGTRKDKPDNSDAQDYVVPIGGPAPYAPYAPYSYQPGAVNPYRQQLYQYEPQYYPVEPPYYNPAASSPYYYNPAAAPPYYNSPAVPPYYNNPAALPYYNNPAALPYYNPAASSSPAVLAPPLPYTAAASQYHPYHHQPLYEPQQPTVQEAYRSPIPADQFFRQPVTAAPVLPYYGNNNNYFNAPQQQQQLLQHTSPHFRTHINSYYRPAPPAAFLQQRDASASTTPTTVNAEPSAQYDQQQSAAGPFDGNQFHY